MRNPISLMLNLVMLNGFSTKALRIRFYTGEINKLAEFAIVTLATVAEASFRLIEQPLLRLKERYHS